MHRCCVLAVQREEALVGSLAEAHAHGVDVDWGALFVGRGAKQVELPTYAFQRERFWLESRAGAGGLPAAGLSDAEHPLLGAAVPLAGGQGWAFTGRLSLATHPWLADHGVFDTVLLPGTALVELALAAGARVGCEVVEELTLEAPLLLPDQGAVQIQVALAEPDEQGRCELSIYSRLELSEVDGLAHGESDWTRHASGVLAADQGARGRTGARSRGVAAGGRRAGRGRRSL